MLNIGEIAPSFSLKNQHGEIVTLNDYTSEGDVILYFYPADFSPVCTQEACTFRDYYDGVADLGTQVVGVSPQSENSHGRFARMYDIPFPLLSDVGKRVIRSYGVDGPFGMGVRRVTFLIDQDNRVRNRVVSDFFADSHAELLREVLRTQSPAA